MNPPVEVIMAVYNGAAWLPEQLRSLRDQQGVDFLLRFQDDGSDDGSEALPEDALPGRCICGIHPGRHLGAVANFWDLLAQSEGDYTAFCDQDDRWHADRLQKCLSALQEAERKDGPDMPLLVHSDCRLTDEKGSVLHESFFAHQGWDPDAAGLAPLLVQNNVTGCTVMINRALKDIALRFGQPERMEMHDWFLALTAAAFGRVIFLPEALVDYRQHPHNVKGASRRSLPRRALAALGSVQRGRNRIRTTYRQAESFLDMAGDLLPLKARELITAYLATEKMPKIQRIRRVRQLGCVMQNPVTRAGQLLFG